MNGIIATRLAQLSVKYALCMRDSMFPMVANQLARDEVAKQQVQTCLKTHGGLDSATLSFIVSRVPELTEFIKELITLDDLITAVVGTPHVEPIPIPIPKPEFALNLSAACKLWAEAGKRELIHDSLPHELEDRLDETTQSLLIRAQLMQSVDSNMAWMPGIDPQTIVSFCRALQEWAAKFWLSAAALDFAPEDESQASLLQGQRVIYKLRAGMLRPTEPKIAAEDLRRMVSSSQGKIRLELGGRSRIVTSSETTVDMILPDADGNFPFEFPENNH